MAFTALVVRKDGDLVSAKVESVDDVLLPPGNVTVAVEYSSVNYKDGLCLTGQGGLVRTYPHVPGIDYAGEVIESEDDRFPKGSKVILTGWRVGEVSWGGYATRARIDADKLVRLPEGMSTLQAMTIGTAGLSAMLAISALEAHGLVPSAGEVLVTGASGGVGSVAVAILSNLGYSVTAVTGRPENTAYLTELGAMRILDRKDIDHVSKRPLESETWAGCVDAVGGEMLARVLTQMKYGASVAAVGLAGGATLPTTVIPFLLRGVNLLGIDSVMQPVSVRTAAWDRLAALWPGTALAKTTHVIELDQVEATGSAILKGHVTGRTVVRLPRE